MAKMSRGKYNHWRESDDEFDDAIKNIQEEANCDVALSLFDMATSGGNASAAMFWMKCRAGWREKDKQEEEKDNNINITIEGV
jgi:hypothetical protein